MGEQRLCCVLYHCNLPNALWVSPSTEVLQAQRSGSRVQIQVLRRQGEEEFPAESNFSAIISGVQLPLPMVIGMLRHHQSTVVPPPLHTHFTHICEVIELNLTD